MKNTTKTLVLALALAGVLAIGGIAAYFTDADTVTNTFTTGKISLKLLEPAWNPEQAQNITPMQKIAKDPQIRNDGTNPEYVFMEVVVPYEKLLTVNEGGKKNAAADTDLWSYEIKEGWAQVGEGSTDDRKKTHTYLYVYGSSAACTALEKDAVTPALFESVVFVNAVEGQGLEDSVKEIVVNAYGIQTSDINGGKTAPADVWSVLSAQPPALD